MAKDAKGHGSEGHMREHDRHWAATDAHKADWVKHSRAGNMREAANAMAAMKESGSLARHHLRAAQKGFAVKVAEGKRPRDT